MDRPDRSSAGVGLSSPGALAGSVPDRVYVRVETLGRLPVCVWGMEHAGLRSEVVQPIVRSRRSAGGRSAAARGIEADLRRGVGLEA